jgi:hypothetical protein
MIIGLRLCCASFAHEIVRRRRGSTYDGRELDDSRVSVDNMVRGAAIEKGYFMNLYLFINNYIEHFGLQQPVFAHPVFD